MRATRLLHDRGQSIWLDFTRQGLAGEDLFFEHASWKQLMGVIASKSSALRVEALA